MKTPYPQKLIILLILILIIDIIVKHRQFLVRIMICLLDFPECATVGSGKVGIRDHSSWGGPSC